MTRTPNLQLCQWASTDVVDVSQVNENFTKLDNVGVRLDGADSKFQTVNGQFSAVDNKINSVDAKFGGVNTRLNAADSRLNNADAKFLDVDARLARTGHIKLKEIITQAPAEAISFNISDIDFKQWHTLTVWLSSNTPEKLIVTSLYYIQKSGGSYQMVPQSGVNDVPLILTFYCLYHDTVPTFVEFFTNVGSSTPRTSYSVPKATGELVLSCTHTGNTLPAGVKIMIWGEH